ncbi:serine endoprotease DegQ [Colwellia sp. MT41]|uniref:Serine endoprotease DegQ n=1 Tax=Colwellia marinimaniae TaxID=1513592 RepID=A0ABQ0MR10_9GAMM|nr:MULTISPECIES: Do family serine endopeptidase [Colwellia]ALO35879.1 serine endoprotease DegQ [Colwellia sp. MT41]GAW94627.1 serine endoprotease DegQ [Colwellia marinimaniae]
MKKSSKLSKLSLVISAALFSSTLALTSAPVLANWPVQVDGQVMPSLAPMLEHITPAVVSISVIGTHKVPQQNVPDAFKFFFGNKRQSQPQPQPFRGLGSGVIIDSEKGYIVTNYHVIENADEIMVTLKDGRQLEAIKIGSDAKSDIALLQIKSDNLIEIKLADSDELRVGDFAIAIGSPFGLGQTVTSGIVSALGRSNLNIEHYEDFIQTDAAINSGNSGGALVNLRGELIGINTAIIGPGGGNVGIGFAIPSNMMHNLIKQIIEFGEVHRGILGVSGRSVNSEIAKAMELNISQGGFIEQVMPDSAADEAGIKAGDVIVGMNGKSIKSFLELRAKIGSIGANTTVNLTIIRDGDKKVFTVKLKQDQSADISPASIHRMLAGAQLENSTKKQAIIIEQVAQGSPAQMAGLKAGDIITGVNRKRIKDIAQLRDYLKDKTGVLALNIVRDNHAQYIMIR